MKFLMFFVMALLLASSSVSANPLDVPKAGEVAAELDCDLILRRVPRVPQEHNFTCGVACVRSLILHYFKWDLGEAYIGNAMGTFQIGYTHPDSIVSFLQSRNLFAQKEEGKSINDLRRFLRQGDNLMLTYMVNGIPHYGILKVLSTNYIWLMDPLEAWRGHDRIMTTEEFELIWHMKWGTVYVPSPVIRVNRQPLE